MAVVIVVACGVSHAQPISEDLVEETDPPVEIGSGADPAGAPAPKLGVPASTDGDDPGVTVRSTAPTLPTTDTIIGSGKFRGFTDKPRWEAGIGGGFLEGYDYPASDDPNQRVLVLPFFIYRSAVVRLGGGGVRAVALESPRLKVDVSFGGSLSSSSEGGGAREGMPDLDYLFEVGPRVQLTLANRATEDGGRWQASASAALRYALSTDFGNLKGRGLVGQLALGVSRRRVFGSRFDLISRVGATFTEDRLQEYYYEVAPRYATPARAAYDAGGGYLGTTAFLGFAYRPTPRVRFFAGVGYANYAGAANESSPLFEKKDGGTLAVGFAWTIKQSDVMVPIVDLD